MLSPKRRTALVASAALFGALFALLGLVPISRLIGISSFISMRESVSPLGGMLFGPVGGGLSIVLGVVLDFGLGRPVVFLGLDFLIDLTAAVVAGLCFTGRGKLALGLEVVLMAAFLLGPAPSILVSVGGAQVPFIWMHALSAVVLAGALLLNGRGRMDRLGVPFVASVFFASTMSAHLMGGILTQFVYLGRGVLFGASTIADYWYLVFLAYPAERLFLTIVGTAVSVPVLRALSRRQAKVSTAS